MLNGNGAGMLHHGGKDIKVPKYTLRKWIDAKNEYVEWDVDCKADEVQAYVSNIMLKKFLSFQGLFHSKVVYYQKLTMVGKII